MHKPSISDVDYIKIREKSRDIGNGIFVLKYSETGDTFFAKRINCPGFHLEKVLESNEEFFGHLRRKFMKYRRRK